MKKAIPIALALTFVLLAAMSLVSCIPGKMEDIVGTYRLETDTVTKYEQETVDNIETYGRESYLVVTGKEMGYYVYKDKDTLAFAREVKFEYTVNDEGKVTSVGYVPGVGDRGRSFNVDVKKEVRLISRWPSASKLIDAFDITYKKISSATDLSAVREACGDLPVFGYDLYDYNSTFYAEIANGLDKHFSPYIYKYIAVDAAACKATLYYALKADKVPVVKTGIDVSFARNPENGKPVGMTIGTDEYDLTPGVPRREISLDVNGTTVDTYEELGWFNAPEVAPEDYDEYFRSLIEAYEAEQAKGGQTQT